MTLVRCWGIKGPTLIYGGKYDGMDQMRFDALGVNGQKIARTPAVDTLAANGINNTRAHNQNIVCMPARSAMVTGNMSRPIASG